VGKDIEGVLQEGWDFLGEGCKQGVAAAWFRVRGAAPSVVVISYSGDAAREGLSYMLTLSKMLIL
jgi:hypothetical protein